MPCESPSIHSFHLPTWTSSGEDTLSPTTSKPTNLCWSMTPITKEEAARDYKKSSWMKCWGRMKKRWGRRWTFRIYRSEIYVFVDSSSYFVWNHSFSILFLFQMHFGSMSSQWLSLLEFFPTIFANMFLRQLVWLITIFLFDPLLHLIDSLLPLFQKFLERSGDLDLSWDEGQERVRKVVEVDVGTEFQVSIRYGLWLRDSVNLEDGGGIHDCWK